MNDVHDIPRSPLLTDEELDALIQGFNHRGPAAQDSDRTKWWWVVSLIFMAGVGLGWWL